MRKAGVCMHGIPAGYLVEEKAGGEYRFTYLAEYNGPPISLTLPLRDGSYHFEEFPAFFEGLLPEGIMLEGLLRQAKIDRDDTFGQLLAVGHDLVGAVTVLEADTE
ncbi:MAG: HipA N-terminal domain-containing protein [Lentisphaeria bacterium]|nr:HipA N-terminal domain-containing protein [Lentisphaeria bacterium]